MQPYACQTQHLDYAGEADAEIRNKLSMLQPKARANL